MDKDYTNLIRLLIQADDRSLGDESVTSILSRAQSVDASVKRTVAENYDDIKIFVASRKADIYPRHLLLERLQLKLLDAVLLDVNASQVSSWKPEQIIEKINHDIVEGKGDFKLNKIDNILDIIHKIQTVEKVNRSIDLIYYYDLAQKAYFHMPYFRNLEQNVIENIIRDLENNFPRVRYTLSDETASKKIATACLLSKGFTQSQLSPLTAPSLFEIMKDIFFCCVATLILRSTNKSNSYTSAEAVDTLDLLMVDDQIMSNWD
ncbi:MAG: hypothetical protein WC227_00480 [Patescibacteria group bacterium]|jgi:hypothetical protein